MSPQEILTTVTLAVSGWTLLEVIKQGKEIAALKAQLALDEHDRREREE